MENCSICHHPLNEQELSCPCCSHKISTTPPDVAKTLAYSLTALILYLPANLLPVMTIEMYGQKNETTIWQGIVSLAEGGDWILALVVFVASMLIPFIKLAILFYLAVSFKNSKNSKFKIKLFILLKL